MLSGDEAWSLGDVFRQESQLRLTVLSCCDTGTVDNKIPDEAIEFPGGLVSAGSAGVISTLWPISDLVASY